MKHIEKNMECIVFKEDELDLIFATVYRLQRYMYSIGALIHEQFQSLIKQPGIIVDKTHLFWEISTKTL